jgi:Holliday junction resolvase
MPNPNYVKGRRKEYQIVNRHKALGHIAFRSAGSHSIVDVTAIDTKNRIIHFIQSKVGKISAREKDEYLSQIPKGTYKVEMTLE